MAKNNSKYKSVPLGELVTLQQGLAINKKSKHLLVEKSSLSLLRITDLINDKKTQYVDEAAVPKQFIADDASLIYTRTGQVGLVFRNRQGVVHNNCFKIIFGNDLDKDYLYYALKQNRVYNHANQIAQKAAQPDLTHGAFKSISIELHPIKIQKRIGSILNAYDNLIDLNQKRVSLLEEMAQAIYIEWFVNFRFPGHENVKLVDSKTDFGEIPEGWTVEKMLDVGQVITGKTPSKLIESNFGHEVPFIKTPDLHGNIFCIKTSEYLSEKGANSQKKKTLPRNTLIVSCIGTLGVVSITTKESQTNQQINALVPNDDTFLEYGYFLLKGMKKQLQNLGSNGATMGNVNKGKFENIKVILPSKANLNEFNQVTSTMFQLIENLQKQNLYLTQTRDLLIPKLVTGEIEIKA